MDGLGQRGTRARAGAEDRRARSRPRNKNRDHRHLRRLRESLNTMRDGVFQGGQGRQLSGQPPEGLRAGHGRRTGRGAQNIWKQTQAHTSEEAPSRTTEDPAQKDEKTTGRGGPRGPRQELGLRVQRVQKGARGQQARTCRALRFQISKVIVA